MIPHFATYGATIVRYPIKKQARDRFAILSLHVSRDVTSIGAGPLSPKHCELEMVEVFLSLAVGFLAYYGSFCATVPLGVEMDCRIASTRASVVSKKP